MEHIVALTAAEILLGYFANIMLIKTEVIHQAHDEMDKMDYHIRFII